MYKFASSVYADDGFAPSSASVAALASKPLRWTEATICSTDTLEAR